MKKLKLCLYGFIATIALLLLSQQIHISYLKKSTQADLDFIHRKLLEYHPGVNSADEPYFIKAINEAYKSAQDAITNMRSSTNQTEIIKNYLALFDRNDIHFFSTTQLAPVVDSANIQVDIVNLPSNIGKLQLPSKKCCIPCEALTTTN